MTHSELTDNLTFLSAVRMLKRLADKGLLTETEAKSAEESLKRKLRPTI